MNNSNQFSSLLLVAATAGVASFGLANTEFAARLPIEALLGVTLSLGLLRMAYSDYTRRPKPLSVPAAILRPLPNQSVRVSAQVGRLAA